MPAPEIIKKLVDQFTQNRESYRSGKYNEAQLRQEFLDPFFEALGWDVYNKNGYSLDYREVVIEDSLDIEGASKSPDYAFKIGKERKFYVEAKKPKVDIQYDIHPAYQLRRYAWNAHLPLSILTDFEELAVYNCKNRPNPQDSAATARDLFFRYTDYVDRWDELAAIFSKEAVLKGAFDRYADSSSGKKGTTEVDDAFLEDIESWRKLLAQNIALRNPQVTDERRLNFAVQMTIDRIIFLRICEDRGIEPDEQLKDLTKAPTFIPAWSSSSSALTRSTILASSTLPQRRATTAPPIPLPPIWSSTIRSSKRSSRASITPANISSKRSPSRSSARSMSSSSARSFT